MRRVLPALLIVLTSPALASAQDAATLPKLATEVAFPNLKFDRPVALAYPDDGGNLLFVVEQHQAKIWSFPNDKATADKQLFLDLPDPISRDNEEGLLGLAFHPKYKQNGEFFVYYSANDSKKGGPSRRSVVSRFKVSKDDPRKADPKSEERIWVGEPDPYGNHNGGCIEFGPDGFLYISLGDSGAGGDPMSTGQNPTDWWASILRIDVDHPSDGKPYGIPADNPVSKGGAYSRWAPEVYAIGLRNVWKFTFDRETGTLWAGDVGQNLYEMVHIIKNGGNYGWSIKEGVPPVRTPPPPEGRARRRDHARRWSSTPTPRPPTARTTARASPAATSTAARPCPNWSASTSTATSTPAGSGASASATARPSPAPSWSTCKTNPKLTIAAFGEDPEGELYILAFDGRIHRLTRPK